MDGTENIGALAFHFTAGAAAGALFLHLSADPHSLSFPLLCVLAALVAASLGTGRTAFLFPAFLCCGVFCVFTDSFAGGGWETLLERWAAVPAGRFRAFIDTVPFPSEHTAPLLKAFLTGDRSGLSRETVQAFRGSGASHLLALSGLHMGILYLILSRMLRPFGNSPAVRRVRYVLTVLAAGVFTLMTGASPSIVRAFLFIFLNETARMSGRSRPPLQILSTALLIQLVLSPSSIISAGFQLSYLAMAGIFLLFPHLEAWYPEGLRFDPVRKVWKAAALSISCQAFTGPLAWLRFRSFPVYFLLTNLLAMPLTTLLIASSVATLALYATGCCPGFLIRVTDILADRLVWILQVISSM